MLGVNLRVRLRKIPKIDTHPFSVELRHLLRPAISLLLKPKNPNKKRGSLNSRLTDIGDLPHGKVRLRPIPDNKCQNGKEKQIEKKLLMQQTQSMNRWPLLRILPEGTEHSPHYMIPFNIYIYIYLPISYFFNIYLSPTMMTHETPAYPRYALP